MVVDGRARMYTAVEIGVVDWKYSHLLHDLALVGLAHILKARVHIEEQRRGFVALGQPAGHQVRDAEDHGSPQGQVPIW